MPLHFVSIKACCCQVFAGSIAQIMEPKEDEAQGTPPWMHAAKDMGVTFAPAEQPPWLLAAVEQGVVFYDPEGREIEVPASQVLALNEALSKVRDFEETWQSTAGSDHSEKQDSAEATEAEGATESASQRRDLKAFVQKIYFKLLREGVEPNEAAAQAILQAAGQQQGQEQQQGQQGQEQQECVAPAPLGGQQSCSLSASGKSGQARKEVTVFAWVRIGAA